MSAVCSHSTLLKLTLAPFATVLVRMSLRDDDILRNLLYCMHATDDTVPLSAAFFPAVYCCFQFLEEVDGNLRPNLSPQIHLGFQI